MVEKIKSFFNNKVVQIVEFVLIALCCAGLIFAGISYEEVAKVPALVVGILSAISALIMFIKGLVSE